MKSRKPKSRKAKVLVTPQRLPRVFLRLRESMQRFLGENKDKRAVAYYREPANSDGTVEQQRAAARAFARKQGRKIVGEFRDANREQ